MIEKRGNKWVLFSKDGSQILGEHDTEDGAIAQEQAINIAKLKRARGKK